MEQSKSAEWATPTTLYRAYSVAPEFPHRGRTYRNLKLVWLADRDEPPVPYEKAIADYEQLCQEDDPIYVNGCINELFTEAEAHALAAYLSTEHGVKTTLKAVPLPMDCKNRLPVGAVAAGGPIDFYRLNHETGYNLSFPVWGYYDVRMCPPEVGLLRRIINCFKPKPVEQPVAMDEAGIPF